MNIEKCIKIATQSDTITLELIRILRVSLILMGCFYNNSQFSFDNLD
jgi:hypothetical protein